MAAWDLAEIVNPTGERMQWRPDYSITVYVATGTLPVVDIGTAGYTLPGVSSGEAGR